MGFKKKNMPCMEQMDFVRDFFYWIWEKEIKFEYF
jgi:hypothetical protein